MDILTAPKMTIPDTASSKDFWVVVTDMDGTLLDHHTYAFEQALPALNELRRLNIPLVFNSSKTRAELMSYAALLGVTSPMVVENGGGIFIPEQADPHAFWADTKKFFHRGQWISLGIPRCDILMAILDIRNCEHIPFRSFSELSIAALQEVTGLSELAAEAAQTRDFSEPLIFDGMESDLKRFRSALRRHGLQVSKGGRFYTVSGMHDKGKAMHWLRSYFGIKAGAAVRMAALGDGPNDLLMLEAADVSIAVKSPVNPALNSSVKKVHHTTACGPKGWSESVLALLHQLELSPGEGGPTELSIK
ncbi:MAG: HAD-IIB family hydrolase [Verrucomicrobiota bacterium]